MTDRIQHPRDNAGRFLPWAAAAIAIGFGSALVFTYAHLLPTVLPGYQDGFISPPHINVTWFSWLCAVAEIGTGIVFGAAGIQAIRRSAEADTLLAGNG
jgi:hypothetical protein